LSSSCPRKVDAEDALTPVQHEEWQLEDGRSAAALDENFRIAFDLDVRKVRELGEGTPEEGQEVSPSTHDGSKSVR